MSYEIVKSISRKKDKLFITSASNNLWPRTYYKWEFMPAEEYDANKVANKELYLFHGIIGGSYQLNKSVNENWVYAENKFYEYCKNNNLSVYGIWDLPSKNNGDIETLKPYYEIFKQYLDERKEGKYYLACNLGYISKVNNKSLIYKPILSKFDLEKGCRNYKKVYNDYCNISDYTKSKYNIEIKEYVLDKNNDNSNLKDKETMEI